MPSLFLCRLFPSVLFGIGLLITQTVYGQNVDNPPSDAAVLVGGDVTLACELSHPLDGLENLKWGQISENIIDKTYGTLFFITHDGVVSLYTELSRYSIDISGNNYNMIITDAQLLDDAQYSCWSANQPASGAQLTVAVQASNLEIYNGLDESEVYGSGTTVDGTDGISMSLSCGVEEGRPRAEFTWYRDNQELECTEPACNSEYTDNQEQLGTFDTVGTYSFAPGPSDHGAVFRCTAVQAAEPVDDPQSVEVVLNVKYAPIVNLNFEKASLEVTCDIDANPSQIDSYKWLVNGTKDNATTSTWMAPQELKSQLTITCIATNSIGFGEQAITIGPYGLVTVKDSTEAMVITVKPGSSFSKADNLRVSAALMLSLVLTYFILIFKNPY